jgi:ATP-dependent RNA helicase MRH4
LTSTFLFNASTLATMQRATKDVCIFCRTKILSQPSRPLTNFGTATLNAAIPSQSRWLSHSSPSYGRQLAKRKPSRMELSRTVATPKMEPLKSGKLGRAPPRRAMVAGPFAAMNQTVAHVPQDRAQRRPSLAEQRRQTRHAKTNTPLAATKEKNAEYRALKMQRALAEMSYRRRNEIKTRIAEVESFDDFGLLPAVRTAIEEQALESMAGVRPTPVQRVAVPVLMGMAPGKKRRKVEPDGKMKQFLIAAETGSGKTLAYLVPTVDALKRQEEEDGKELEGMDEKPEETTPKDLYQMDALAELEEQMIRPGRPRVIILVPSAELVDQVGAVAKAFSHGVKFRASLISSAYSSTIIRNRLFAPGGVDLLVSTPQLLANIIKSNPSVVSRVTHLVIDEADSLLDRSFEEFTNDIVARAEPSLKQLIMCSATIPRRMDNYLRDNYPGIIRLTTPNLHAIPRRVQLGVVDTQKGNYHGNKDLACADTIWSIGSAQHDQDASPEDKSSIKRFLVFVNEREKADEVADYLRNKGITAEAFHRDLEIRKQKDLLADFTGSLATADEAANNNPFAATKSQSRRSLPNVRVLVVTDLASRGIDTTAVRHVILYDVPHTTIDFIHRLGRVGRMGRRGRGIVLLGKGDRRDVVREVQDGMFRGKALV